MMFRRKWTVLTIASAVLAAASLLFSTGSAALAGPKFAVVPTEIIYPGQALEPNRLEEVEVTNPNIAPGYAETIGEVAGLISSRTLLPGRTIPVAGLREPHAVKRGNNLRLTFSLGNMVISAAGSPLQDAAVGDVIKVRNLDSGMIVSGTVMADGTVQVMAR